MGDVRSRTLLSSGSIGVPRRALVILSPRLRGSEHRTVSVTYSPGPTARVSDKTRHRRKTCSAAHADSGDDCRRFPGVRTAAPLLKASHNPNAEAGRPGFPLNVVFCR